MVSMIPFDLVRLDNTEGGGDNKLPVMDRILNLGKVCTVWFSLKSCINFWEDWFCRTLRYVDIYISGRQTLPPPPPSIIIINYIHFGLLYIIYYVIINIIIITKGTSCSCRLTIYTSIREQTYCALLWYINVWWWLIRLSADCAYISLLSWSHINHDVITDNSALIIK